LPTDATTHSRVVSTKQRALTLAVCLCCAATGGCGGEGAPTAAPVHAHQALVDGTIDTDTTGVLALLLLARGQWLFQCTGALVAPNVVLTAGHCVLAWDPSATTAAAACDGNAMPRLASPDDLVVVSGANADENAYRVERVGVPSTSADDATRVTDLCSQDLGLLVLQESIPASEAQPLPLRSSQPASPGDVFDAVGFGADDASDIDVETVRRRAHGTVDCVAGDCALAADVRDGEWLSQDIFACAGDSGSPALDQAGEISGVVSRGFSDCHGVIYEDVAYFGDFLQRELLAAASVPTGAEREAARCTLSRARGGRALVWPVFAAAGLAIAALSRRLRRVGAR
jgi:hypothetical protein